MNNYQVGTRQRGTIKKLNWLLVTKDNFSIRNACVDVGYEPVQYTAKMSLIFAIEATIDLEYKNVFTSPRLSRTFSR